MFDIDIPFTIPVLLAGAQIFLDFVLILIVLFLLKRISNFDVEKFSKIISTLKESEELCSRLNKTVEEHSRIASNIQNIVSASRKACQGSPESHQADEPGMQARVLDMWGRGMGIDEIADATGLGKGEVEVITALAKESAGKYMKRPG